MRTLNRWTATALAFVLALLGAVPPLLAAAAERGSLVIAGGFVAVADTLNRTVLGWMHPALRSAGIVNAAGADLAKIVAELKAIQEAHRGKAMPADVGTRFEELAAQAKAMQDEADREKQVKGFEAFSREVPDAPLPADGGSAKADSDIAGYVSLGSLFVRSPEFKAFADGGRPQAGSVPFRVKGGLGSSRDLYLPVTREEAKALATVGADVIAPQRLPEMVRITENDRLTMRDLLNVSRTSAPSVEYVTFTPATPVAAVVAPAAAKPEMTMTLGTATAPVRTIAVHMPVTEQQLQDVPGLENMIDVQGRYEVGLAEEQELTWADGTGQHLLGIFSTPNVLVARTVGGDTQLDQIRRARTDVALAGSTANGIVMHPLDWEATQLLKGTDDRYVWVVVTGPEGDRVWAMRVVESLAMEAPTADATPERRILVGDFTRGATIWDRMDATVAVGWINDQFTKNLRTIRIEERLAFGVQRPRAFRYIVSQVAVP